ncbi:MAG TPA: ABC transporter permease subunit [Microbacteriaceae bacterium]|nr:ABC transporter permease subunit [Microbacteriaceae bacterium]
MTVLLEALTWIFSGDPGRGVDPIGIAALQHLGYTLVSVLIAAAIAIPLGWWIGHTGRGRQLAIGMSGAARAIPSFGLLVLLVLLIGVLHKPEAAVVSYILLAIPSILAGAYTGFEAIDRAVVSASRAIGMTEMQLLWRVEVPLGLPLLVAGLRAATLQVVATVTIGAYVGLGGLGQYIIAGIPLRQYDMVLGGALLIAALALALDGLFALAQRMAVPEGLRRSDGRPTTPHRGELAAARPT